MPTANRVLFQAAGVLGNPVLWVSDGTAAGTSQLFASTANTPIRASQGYVQLGNRVVFSANDGTHGAELWVTDGLSAHTSMLVDINPGTADGFSPVAAGGGFAYLANGVVIGSQFIFSATYGNGTTSTGNALYVTDGTTAGTSLFKDLATGPNRFAYAANFTSVGGTTLFHAADPGHNSDLWMTDGTAAGTTVVRNAPTSSDAGYFDNVSDITALGTTGLAVFQASESTHGKELWVTNKTSAGTSMLVDINGGISSSNIANITALGTSGKAIFTADTGTLTQQLWVTDGTSAGTSLLLGNRGVNGYFFSTVNNKGVFGTSDGHIWATDGTTAGTFEIIASAMFNTHFYPQFTLGTKLIFETDPAGFSPTLWATDGTVAGTVHLSSSVVVGDLTNTAVVLGSNLLFAGRDTTSGSTIGNELWSTNGTAAGTGLVFNINNNGSNANSDPQNFAVIGSKAVFQANDGTHGAELWTSGGTFFDTSLVKDILNNFAQSSSPSSVAAVTIACFAAGTRISTDGGEIPVQALRVGDNVCLAGGGSSPVVWIGHRSLDLARHPNPVEVAPVRVAAHAFGPGRPHTMLRLSPDHAIYSHNVLVPIRHLINGTTIAREAVANVTYYHVELEAHGVLLAEGLACESYLDGGDTRDAFEAGATQILHPVFGHPSEASPCAPVVSQGVILQAVRALVASHVNALCDAAQIAC